VRGLRYWLPGVVGGRYDVLTMAETLKTELECLRSIDESLRTLKRIAVWWAWLSVISCAVYLIYLLTRIDWLAL
jgi:hypothetical protein